MMELTERERVGGQLDMAQRQLRALMAKEKPAPKEVTIAEREVQRLTRHLQLFSEES